MGIQERKEREFKRREQEILDAALCLFRCDNWQSVTVDEIAEKTEIGKGTIYKHFGSKDEIYARLALDFQRGILRDLQSIDPTLGVIKKVRAIVKVYWDAHVKSKEHHRLAQYCLRADFQARLGEAMRRQFQEIDGEITGYIYDVARQGIREGVFPDKPLPLLICGARSAMNGAVQMVWDGELGKTDLNRYRREITDFIVAGLRYQGRAS